MESVEKDQLEHFVQVDASQRERTDGELWQFSEKLFRARVGFCDWRIRSQVVAILNSKFKFHCTKLANPPSFASHI